MVVENLSLEKGLNEIFEGKICLNFTSLLTLTPSSL